MARVEVVLRPARREEASALSALALRSKGHWGYPAEQLEAFRAELTLDPDDLDGVVVASDGGRLLGYRRVIIDGPSAELDALFVDPPFIGSGVGARLLADALAAARVAGALSVGLDADPDAESFYRRHGARTVGRSPSGSIPGRTLPRMEFDLS